jgi:hypothetical protein
MRYRFPSGLGESLDFLSPFDTPQGRSHPLRLVGRSALGNPTQSDGAPVSVRYA